MIRLLHLTDLHFGSSLQKNITSKDGDCDFDKEFETIPANYIKTTIDELEPLPDLILFSGDFVTGKDKVKDYSKTQNLIKEILDESNNLFSTWTDKTIDLKKRILIVPGNHDVSFKTIDSTEEFKKAFRDYNTPYTKKSGDFFKSAPLYYFPELNILIYCLSTIEISGKPVENIESILNTLKSIKLSNIEDKKLVNKQIKKLKNKLHPDRHGTPTAIIDEFRKQNRQFKNGHKDTFDGMTKIILCHHPFFLPEDVDTSPYNNMISGTKFLRNAMEFGYQMVIHGHTHSKQIISINDGEMNNNMLHIGTPSLGKQNVMNGISTIDIKDDNGISIDVTYRNFNPDTNCFYPEKYLEGIILSKANKIENFFEDIKNKRAGNKILLDFELKSLIVSNIIIKNGDIDRIQPSHYDCALGYHYTKDGEDFTVEPSLTAKAAAIKIKPGDFINVETFETFDIPKDYIFHVSVLARWMKKGVIANISTFADAGFKGPFKFPLYNIGKDEVELEMNKSILSIEVVKLDTEVEKGWHERKQEKDES